MSATKTRPFYSALGLAAIAAAAMDVPESPKRRGKPGSIRVRPTNPPRPLPRISYKDDIDLGGHRIRRSKRTVRQARTKLALGGRLRNA